MNQPQEEVRPNLVPITFAEDQIGFAAGALAARISETRDRRRRLAKHRTLIRCGDIARDFARAQSLWMKT